ncbi:MAG TPA: metallophosphoesterase family protein [Chitinophagaceae bacterium]|jgi:putative phosphoesterase|nr:metallophosphoesterase family protein [Chitinophagaceae bacterium]
MKIALFSDIHANLPALQALFQQLDHQRPDAVYCLGDLVGYNVWPNEVINAIRDRRIPTIKGNYDEGIGGGTDECGCAYKTDEERDMGKISISVTNARVQPEERAYLAALPAHIRVEFRSGEESISLLLVHGSPRRINEYLFEDREEKSLLRILKDARADILCFGHTHKPWHRVLPDETTSGTSRYLHAINTGSVGKPKDGDPRGCFVLLHLDGQSTLSDPGSVRVEFIRFGYDVEAAAKAVEESPLPDAYADMLRKGK